MNDRKQIARIVLLANGELHILLKNNQSVYCTIDSVIDFFSEPYDFLEEHYQKYEASTRCVMKKRQELEAYPGLTMAACYEDTSLEVFYPVFFQLLFEKLAMRSQEHLSLDAFRFQSEFSDQKQYFIRLFLDFMQVPELEFEVKRKISMGSGVQEAIFREILDTSFSILPNGKAESGEDCADPNGMPKPAKEKSLFSTNVHRMVTTQEYADAHGVGRGTVYNWISHNKLSTATKDAKGNWMIDLAEKLPADRRRGRMGIVKRDGTMRTRLKGSSYTAVQEYIQERKLVTDRIRPFIRTYQEIKFYENRNYHEVAWNRNALIIDIHPDYFCKQLGKTNRQLILEGKSPVVPGTEEGELTIYGTKKFLVPNLSYVPRSSYWPEKGQSICDYPK